MMGRLGNLGGLWASSKGSAAAEMVLVLPLLVMLMFGSAELGKYFLDEHVAVKAVRDGARYASRQGFSQYVCPAGTVSTDVTNRTRNIVRFGNPAGTGNPRLSYWQALSDGQPSVQVTVQCPATLDGTEVAGGLYEGDPHIPLVTVAAVVEYESLFGMFAWADATLDVKAESQSAVMGI
jgi:Flp pilus assembly protein TadG